MSTSLDNRLARLSLTCNAPRLTKRQIKRCGRANNVKTPTTPSQSEPPPPHTLDILEKKLARMTLSRNAKDQYQHRRRVRLLESAMAEAKPEHMALVARFFKVYEPIQMSTNSLYRAWGVLDDLKWGKTLRDRTVRRKLCAMAEGVQNVATLPLRSRSKTVLGESGGKGDNELEGKALAVKEEWNGIDDEQELEGIDDGEDDVEMKI